MYSFSSKSLLQLFYFSTMIPVRLYIQHRLYWQLPHNLKTFSEHMNLPSPHEYPHIQTFTNEWDEQFWSYQHDNLAIIIGPIFLNKLPRREKLRKTATYYNITMKTYNKIFDNVEKTATIISDKQFTYGHILLQAMIETMQKELIIEPETSTLPQLKQDFTKELMENNFESLYVLEKQLVEDIKNGYHDHAIVTLDEIIEQITTKDPDTQENNLLALCPLIATAFIDSGFNVNLAQSLANNWMNTIRKKFEPNQIHATITAIFKSFSQLHSSQNYIHLHPSVSRALFYIDSHITEKMTITDIADYANIHPNHLSNLFKKELQSTVIHTINQKKIENSCHLLCHSNESIVEIALLFNFCNQTYYAKWFKKYIGMTPGEYRKNYKKIYSIDHRKIIE